MAKKDGKKKTSIGGQAVMEGVMMRGPKSAAVAVRRPDGGIELRKDVTVPLNRRVKVLRIPVIRGVAALIESFTSGYRYLSYSAEVSGMAEEEGEPGRFERWLTRVFGKHLMSALMVVAMVLGVALAIGLFMYLPALLVSLLPEMPGVARSLIEGAIKILIFVLYVVLVSRMKEIYRVFQYHGAEHKTIFCYEAGEPLTVENVRKHKRFHPRCGTSFILITLIISILVFSVVSWDNIWIRVGLKLAALPVVVGLSYEIIRFAGRHVNWFTRAISAPGVWLQHATTKEPDDGMIEVAIAAMNAVLEDGGDDKW